MGFSMKSRIGNRIKILRQARSLSMQQLGDLIGVSTGTIHYWESATYRCPDRSIQDLAAVFGVSTDHFYVSDPETNNEAA